MTARRFSSGENYRDAANLAARQDLYAYKRPDYDLPGIVAECIIGSPGRILDVGCGNGLYTRRLRQTFPDAETIAIDRSAGMLADVPAPTLVADAADLPIDDDSANIVLAMHVLYHLPDIPVGLDELERVLAPDGVLFVSTLAEDDKAESALLWRRAAEAALGFDVGDRRRVVLDRFSLATAERMLRERFGSVRLHDIPGVIELPEPGPLLAAYRSARSFVELDDGDFDRVMDAAARMLGEHCDRHRTFRITSHSGILECRRTARPS